MQSGLFIALEGIDGAGTTTQLEPVAKALRQMGHLVSLTAEPSKGPTGLLLREALRGSFDPGEAGLALLFAADRLHHVASVVQPLLQAGHVVITDRYVMSSLAYQSTALGLSFVQHINQHAPLPDAHLFFRVAPELAKARREARGGTDEHFDADARQRAVASSYEALACGADKLDNVHVIDAQQSVSDVTQQVVHCITTLLADKAGAKDRPQALKASTPCR